MLTTSFRRGRRRWLARICIVLVAGVGVALVVWPRSSPPGWAVSAPTLEAAVHTAREVPSGTVALLVIDQAPSPLARQFDEVAARGVALRHGTLLASDLHDLQAMSDIVLLGDEVDVALLADRPARASECDLLSGDSRRLAGCVSASGAGSVAVLGAEEAVAEGLADGTFDADKPLHQLVGHPAVAATDLVVWTGPRPWWSPRRISGTGMVAGAMLGGLIPAIVRRRRRRPDVAPEDTADSRVWAATSPTADEDDPCETSDLDASTGTLPPVVQTLPTQPPCADASPVERLFASPLCDDLDADDEADAAARPVLPPAAPGNGAAAAVLADGGQLPGMVYRAGSVRGAIHRRHSVRQDSLAITATDGRLLIAVADGVSAAARSDAGSRQACEAAIEQLLADPEAPERALTAADDALRTLANHLDIAAGQLATTLTVAVVDAPTTEQAGSVTVVGVGDSPPGRLRDRTWQVVSAKQANGATEALPYHPDRGWQLTFDLQATDVFLVATDGVGDLLTVPEHRDWFAEVWTTPPGVLEFVEQVGVYDEQLGDDRTAVAVWFTDRADTEKEF